MHLGSQLEHAERGEHFFLEVLVVQVKWRDCLWRSATFGVLDSCQHGFEHFLPQDQQAGQDPDPAGLTR